MYAMKNVPLLLLAVFFLVNGCDYTENAPSNPEGGELEVTTNQQEYSLGENVIARFDNERSHAVNYDRCGTALHRGDAEGQPYGGATCAATSAHQPVRIEAGEVYSDTLVWFGSDHSPGTYRFEFDVTDTVGVPLPKTERLTDDVTVVGE